MKIEIKLKCQKNKKKKIRKTDTKKINKQKKNKNNKKTLFWRPRNAVAIELRRLYLESPEPRPPTNRPMPSELRRGAFGGSVVGISVTI